MPAQPPGALGLVRTAPLEPRCQTVVHMLAALQDERQETIKKLMAAVADMVDEIDPDHKRDHRSHWDTTLKAHPGKPDIFDRVRWAADELVVIGTQMAYCQPWRSGTGRVGLVASTPAEQSDVATETVSVFRLLVMRESDPLGRLERDIKGVQLQRRWYGNLRAAALPMAVRQMRAQHTAAGSVVYLLGKIAA